MLSLLLACSLCPQDLTPEEAVRRMKPAEGFQATLVASEPQIRQPLTISFDDRGRIWVIQYIQYPNYAGLTPLSRDQYLRTKYDRVPEPPPRGPKGADRITILEDKDGSGRFQTAKDFVTGLNIASGMALGHGGVYVAQPPYLLFYPHRNGKDIPDGDPEILLTGFGMEDTHSLANSLQWGPDGWLYGAAGSTSTSKIRGIEFQQGIWRYHPITKEFELFAEGGGNTWGLDFDRHGNAIAGTNWGGFACLHQVQGGYYIKGFGKHGPLHNPHTFGYFDHIPYAGFKGGHVTCGGIVYQGGAFPTSFENTYIACNPLSNVLDWHILEPRGSTFTARRGGEFLTGNDPWFRPIDSLVGPDGALYVVDWYDARLNHVDPRDNWDRRNGRIYRVAPKDTPRFGATNLRRLKSSELLSYLSHKNSWYCQEARLILAERRDPSVLPALEKMIEENKGDLALEALWALYVSGGFNDENAGAFLRHPNEYVRAWTVRLIGDARRATETLTVKMLGLCRSDPSAPVRSQLACTAKRLPAPSGLRLASELLRRKEDLDDPFIPLLIWWAIEDKAITERASVLSRFESADDWSAPLTQKYIIERLARRYMAQGGDEDLAACATLLVRAPGDLVLKVVDGMEQALEGRRLDRVPPPLQKPLATLWEREGKNLKVLRLALRLGSAEAFETALERLADSKSIELVTVLGQSGKPEVVPVLLKLLLGAQNDAFVQAILTALQPFQNPEIPTAVIAQYPRLGGQSRARARSLLLSRPASALEFLQLVDAGKVAAKEVPLENLTPLADFKNEAIAKLVEKHWGKVGAATPGEKRAQIASIKNILAHGRGDRTRGKALFTKTCGVCHTLFGEGNKIGPELDGQDRKNLDVLLTNIVDPSAVIRPEFVARKVRTTDGQVIVGLIVEQSAGAVTIVDAQNNRTTVARARIDRMIDSEASLMPEKLLDPFTDPEICDFFAYLQAEKGIPGAAPGAASGHPHAAADKLSGTAAIEGDHDFASEMVAGIDKFLLREIDRSVEQRRAKYWKRDTSSKEAYEKSVSANRERFMRSIGVVDARVPFDSPELVSTINRSSILGKTDKVEIHAIRWPVVRGIWGEGLLLVPVGRNPVGDMIFLSDPIRLPEVAAGLTSDHQEIHVGAWRQAKAGCRVVVPVLIDRSDTFSVSAAGKATNQPHREFVYRPAFEMGRHVIGYEVQKVLALVDWLRKSGDHPLAVVGDGEGALLALYAGACDSRIDLVVPEGYFESRQAVWKEPIYRNVWRLLEEFGDAEIASLVAPREFHPSLSDEISITGPPQPRSGRAGAAPGTWSTAGGQAMELEKQRFRKLVAGLDLNSSEGTFLIKGVEDDSFPALMGPLPDPAVRMKRQLNQLLEDTQVLLRQSEKVREEYFWKKVSRKSVEEFQKTTAPFREDFDRDVIGKFEEKFLPPNPRSRKLYEEPKYIAYEVQLDVWPDVFAYGWFLVPKDIKEGERRPVVVCQHGLEGRPSDTADPKRNHPAYNQFSCRLAERGFIVFAPQNPYIGQDKFRTLQRKANLLGKHLFSFIIPQHQVITDWLASLPYVDPERIAFYGLSYGGKTAMRVPAVVTRYCLSICSADFNDWIWKNAALDSPYSYVTTGEYEIFEWNLGNTFNYAEMAALIAPRPFMVERGHKDGVAPDERVAYEYAKIKRFYDELKIGDRTELEVFDGPHTIHGVGTFEFLHRHLKWPKPQ